MGKQRISLALGSGGARGLAHIGVIRCLEERGFEINYIAGCSMGALVGGVYAAGKLEDYADWVCALQKRDVFRLLNFAFSREAVFDNDRIISILKDMVGERDIEGLSIGFTAVATDINNMREIWLSRGSLFEAIRASIAYPLLFSPVEYQGLLLVDGGVVNPVPIAPALNDGAAWTFAIDLNGPVERIERATQPANSAAEEPNSLFAQMRENIAAFIDDWVPTNSTPEPDSLTAFELALRSIDTMQTTIARMKLATYTPNLVVEIPSNLCGFLDFHRAKELIEFGYNRMGRALDNRIDQ